MMTAFAVAAILAVLGSPFAGQASPMQGNIGMTPGNIRIAQGNIRMAAPFGNRVCALKIIADDRWSDAAIGIPAPRGDHRIRVIEPPCVAQPPRPR